MGVHWLCNTHAHVEVAFESRACLRAAEAASGCGPGAVNRPDVTAVTYPRHSPRMAMVPRKEPPIAPSDAVSFSDTSNMKYTPAISTLGFLLMIGLSWSALAADSGQQGKPAIHMEDV